LEGVVAEMSNFIVGPNMRFLKLWGLGRKNIVGGPLGQAKKLQSVIQKGWGRAAAE